MKPERTRDRLKSVGTARAKMFLKAHLEWLDGVPVAQSSGRIEWKTRPRVGSTSPKTIVVDRALLRQSQAVLTTLAAHFPTAMAKVVGDVASWHQNVTAILDQLKSAIHDGTDVIGVTSMPVASLSRSQKLLVDQLLHQHSWSSPLLRMVVWSGWVDPSVREFLIPWISNNADWIANHLQSTDVVRGLQTILLAGDLVRLDGEECLSFLRPGLGDPRSFLVSAHDLRNEINRFLKDLRGWRNSTLPAPTRPCRLRAKSYGTRIVAFLDWLANQDRPVRQRATQLAIQVLSYPLVQNWQTAWDKFHSCADRAIRSICQNAKRAHAFEFHSEACRVSHELEKELADEPLPYPFETILDNVQWVTTERTAQFNVVLNELLAAVPTVDADASPNTDGWALRLALLDEARHLDFDVRAIRYYKLSRKFFLSNRHQPFLLLPWAGQIATSKQSGGRWWSPFPTLCNEPLDPQKWPAFFDVLERIAGHSHYTYHRNDAIVWLLKASINVDEACERFLQAAPKGLLGDCNFEQVQAAACLETDGFTFVELLELLVTSGLAEETQLSSVKALHQRFVEAGWTTLVPSLLRMKRAGDVTRVAMQFQIADSAGVPLTFIPKSTCHTIPDWAGHLPSILHDSIATFTSVFPESRQRIQKILDKNFPDPQKVRTEIAALEQLAERQSPLGVNLQRRLDNLNLRLNHPVAISEAALQRMKQRLDDALFTDVFRDTSDRIEPRLMELFGGTTGLREFASHVVPTRHLELVQGILKLAEPYRTYGLRLLRKQWGNVPWDLENEPANRRFADGLTARGIRIEPWLSSRQLVTDYQDQTWTLAFESNEAEKLLMGYYFGTCLSPGSFNFFSAVANAIDLNKRVLYARDSQGVVAGRCLMAIGDAGTIVVFRPYCHTAGFDFDKQVALFATGLAADMGTVVSHADRVSALVAPGWYNDGAHDLGNSIAGEKSLVRAALPNVTEQDLIASLESALHPVGLNPAMLELIVELPEFQSRPQLISPLFPLIEQFEPQLGIATLVVVARLAHQSGHREVASRMLRNNAPDWIRRELARCGIRYSDAIQALQMLIEYRPSAALRILRATRERCVHHDREETDRFRRNLLAACFDALGAQSAGKRHASVAAFAKKCGLDP